MDEIEEREGIVFNSSKSSSFAEIAARIQARISFAAADVGLSFDEFVVCVDKGSVGGFIDGL